MTRARRLSPKANGGFTFVELVIFIVVSSIALVGVLSMYQQATARSSDAIASRQSAEAAYALLEEIEAMPFTYCDPSDPAAGAAASPADCSMPQGLSPGAGKSRGSLTAPFNNVGDYGGYSQTGITDINGNPAPGLGAYSIAVSLSQPALPGVSADAAVRIDILVTGPYGSQTITGYRLRHSPNALP